MAFQGFNNKNRNQSSFTDEMKKHLKANYALMSVEALAEHYGVKPSQVVDQAHRQYLTKRKAKSKK